MLKINFDKSPSNVNFEVVLKHEFRQNCVICSKMKPYKVFWLSQLLMHHQLKHFSDIKMNFQTIVNSRRIIIDEIGEYFPRNQLTLNYLNCAAYFKRKVRDGKEGGKFEGNLP